MAYLFEEKKYQVPAEIPEEEVFTPLKEKKFNSFLLANAFSGRDRLNLWILYRQALRRGVALEELAGVLFWKAKDMILKRNFSKFSEKELKNFATRISYILPESREWGRDNEEALEQFLLQAA